MTERTITHREAREAASRLINSHFRNSDQEYARVSIPANPDRDDDLLVMGYIWQQEASAIEAQRAATENTGAVHESAVDGVGNADGTETPNSSGDRV